MSDRTAHRSSAVHAISMRGPGRGGPGRHFVNFEKPKNLRAVAFRLLSYLEPFKIQMAVVIVLVLATTGLSLVGPYLMGRAIDLFILGRDRAGLMHTVALMAGAYLLAWGTQVLSGRMVGKVSQYALRNIRGELFRRIQELSLSFFDRNPHGELMSRLTNDVEAVNMAVTQNVLQLINSVVGMVGILIMMFSLNFYLALTTLIIVPMLFSVTAFIAKRSRKGFRERQKAVGMMNGLVEETVSGQKTVSAFGRNQSVLMQFQEYNQEVYKKSAYAQTWARVLMPFTAIAGHICIAVIAGVGGVLVLRGAVTVGIVATFISYTQRFTQPLRQISGLYNSVQSALAGAERVFEVLDSEDEIDDKPSAVPMDRVEGRIEFRDVCFSYVPGVPVLKNISLKAHPGQIVALVGPTGAGKTTVANLLTRFYDIDSGQILIDGVSIDGFQKDSLRRRTGLVLQDTFLFSDTVMENIRYGRIDATDEEVIEAAKTAEAHHFIEQMPDGYNTVLSERGGNLSQGQRQLLSIARVILSDPALLILDEATSSVDTRTELRIQQGLMRLMRRRTSFVIAHRLSTIRDADQVLVINNGEIVERGTHDELIAAEGKYYSLYMAQFRGKEI